MDAPAFACNLEPNLTTGAQVEEVQAGTWRLAIPAGPAGRYRLAQLDDYSAAPRRSFPWQPPFEMALRARASASAIPGTWGFGLWNDPFSMGLLSGSGLARWPALPNAAWFFFASPPNYLSLRDDLPAQGGLAAVFRSPQWPTPVLALGAPVLPLALLPPAARLLRRLARRVVRQATASLPIDPAGWHTYTLDWELTAVRFLVDGDEVLRTGVSPLGPLGLVLWVDNQYAALPPSGRLRYGALATPEPAWIEIGALTARGK
ncbi:MAG: hypothetical protein JXA78_16945 [Anaerolineales bacterium]|nr:hypothetical protein [Anaerolineales bacterium]